MSPYKKTDRPTWYVWPTLIGFGRVGPWSTGTTNRQTAERIESFLVEAAIDRPALVQGLVLRKYTLRDLWAARMAKRLDALMSDVHDPSLVEVVDGFRPRIAHDKRYRVGLDHLVRLTPKGARLSFIAQPRDPNNPAGPSGAKHLNAMVAALLAEGLRPNSVARSFYVAVSKMLTEVLGKDGRDRVMRDVPMPSEDDSRDVHLTPEELRGLLAACGDELYPIVSFAMLSGWDLAPIARMTPRDFDPHTGTMLVRDNKNAARKKRERLSDAAVALVRSQMQGKAPDAPLWPLDYGQISRHWNAARKRAGLTWLRFKDLRHIAATAMAEAGANAREIQDYLRHRTGKMALRYLSTLPNQRKDRLNAQAERLDLAHPHIRRKGGAA